MTTPTRITHRAANDKLTVTATWSAPYTEDTTLRVTFDEDGMEEKVQIRGQLDGRWITVKNTKRYAGQLDAIHGYAEEVFEGM